MPDCLLRASGGTGAWGLLIILFAVAEARRTSRRVINGGFTAGPTLSDDQTSSAGATANFRYL